MTPTSHGICSMRKIIFVSGTRADYGKIKSLMQALDSRGFEYHIFACGMHLLPEYGNTHLEISKDGFSNITLANTCDKTMQMDLTLSKTIESLSAFVAKIQPDLILVHGDRLEALAGAIVGAFNNIKVGHIEGGEVSGTIDESIRHSITKLAHVHFSANTEATKRLVQLGENPDFIFEIGSPDIDIMLTTPHSKEILKAIAEYYGIDFIKRDESYAIAIYHPITTKVESLESNIAKFVSALVDSKQNYLIIYPNNDIGSTTIIKQLETLRDNPRFAIYPSIKFEKFLTLLKYSSFIIGNSSAGIREAPIYNIPTINVGERQRGRSFGSSITHTSDEKEEILRAIEGIKPLERPSFDFGRGDSATRFLEVLEDEKIWNLDIQKKFFNL